MKKTGIPFDPHIKKLLLVAGLSCAGKSTLINQLKDGTLAPEIRAALPRSAATWPIVSGKRPGRFKELVSRDKRLPVGQILHCDITGAYFSDAALAHSRIYSENDEVFCRQLASADTIFAVVVSTSHDQLISQVETRSILLHFPPLARSLAAQYVPQLVRFERQLPSLVSTRIVSSLGRRWRHRSKLRDFHSRLLGRYEGATNLEQIYDHWENWLREKCSTLRQLEFLYVEPKSEKGHRSAPRRDRGRPVRTDNLRAPGLVLEDKISFRIITQTELSQRAVF